MLNVPALAGPNLMPEMLLLYVSNIAVQGFSFR
jgi:hypothetical protein